MKLAVMQPYIFPYIGYFQLINCADKFVVLDDVNFINKGWINRNNILVNGKPHLFTIPLKNSSQNKLINELEISNEQKWKEKFFKTIKSAYSKAPFFDEVNNLIFKIINQDQNNLSEFIRNSIKSVCSYLGIESTIEDTSAIYKLKSKGQRRILEICKLENATVYINPIGGLTLYEREIFKNNDIKIFFLKTNDIKYFQFNNHFVPNLSIIDVMMFNGNSNTLDLLSNYSLV